MSTAPLHLGDASASAGLLFRPPTPAVRCLHVELPPAARDAAVSGVRRQPLPTERYDAERNEQDPERWDGLA